MSSEDYERRRKAVDLLRTLVDVHKLVEEGLSAVELKERAVDAEKRELYRADKFAKSVVERGLRISEQAEGADIAQHFPDLVSVEVTRKIPVCVYPRARPAFYVVSDVVAVFNEEVSGGSASARHRMSFKVNDNGVVLDVKLMTNTDGSTNVCCSSEFKRHSNTHAVGCFARGLLTLAGFFEE